MKTRWYHRISTRFALVFYFSFVVTLLVFASLSVWSVRNTTIATIKDNLSHLITFWESYVKTENENPKVKQNLDQFAHQFKSRLTLLDFSGKILYDSEIDSSLLGSIERHNLRPEIIQSEQREFGKDIRRSVSTDHDFYFLAKKFNPPIPFGDSAKISYIRVAYPMQSLTDFYLINSSIVLLILIIFLIIGFFLYKYIAGKLTEPILTMVSVSENITSGNLQSRIPIDTSDELGLLASSINHMAEKLVEDIQQLKKLEKVRSEFLANVSHELRTPIFTIQGFIETLLDGAIDDQTVNRNFLNKIHKNSINLNNLVSDLIEISKIESGELKMKFQSVNLSDLLDDVLENLESKAASKKITIKKHLSEPNIYIWADPDRIYQVFTNLINNAIKYSDNGDISIQCDVFQPNRVLIKIRDQGIGIAKEHLSRIFERFYRVDKHRSKEEGGTGLGLAIVKHIIEAHQSKILVASFPGNGTEFSFYLTRTHHD